MGSEYFVDTRYAYILGHALNPMPANNQISYWTDSVASVSIGTGTTKTLLGGTHVPLTSANYITPSACRCIVAVRPKFYSTTPTANQAAVATVKVESADLKMGDFEVLASPYDSGLGTAEIQFADTSPWYPLMQPTYGGDNVQIYGTAQIANTVAVYMGADLLLADTFPTGFSLPANGQGIWSPGYGPVQSKVVGINYKGGPTSTGTAAASAADGGINITGAKKRLIDIITYVVGTTPAPSKPVAGTLTVSAGELAYNPQRFQIEPITGFLGTTTAGQKVPLSHAGPMNLSLRTPSTLISSMFLDISITTAGNFGTQYMYIDNP